LYSSILGYEFSWRICTRHILCTTSPGGKLCHFTFKSWNIGYDFSWEKTLTILVIKRPKTGMINIWTIKQNTRPNTGALYTLLVSSPELKAQVSYSDHPLSVRPSVRPSVCL
jgi:hypothetical protein